MEHMNEDQKLEQKLNDAWQFIDNARELMIDFQKQSKSPGERKKAQDMVAQMTREIADIKSLVLPYRLKAIMKEIANRMQTFMQRTGSMLDTNRGHNSPHRHHV